MTTYLSGIVSPEFSNQLLKRGVEQSYIIKHDFSDIDQVPEDSRVFVCIDDETGAKARLNDLITNYRDYGGTVRYFKNQMKKAKSLRQYVKWVWYDMPHGWDWTNTFIMNNWLAAGVYKLSSAYCPSMYIDTPNFTEYLIENGMGFCAFMDTIVFDKLIIPWVTLRYCGQERPGQFIAKEPFVKLIRWLLRWTSHVWFWQAELYYRRASTFPPSHPDYNDPEVAAARAVHGDTYKLPNGQPNEDLILKDTTAALNQYLDWIEEARKLGPLP